jgi:Rrf2 family protein
VHGREISHVLGIPHHFLGKILQTLSRYGIVSSQKGMKGGFYLSRDPQRITILDVVAAIEGPAFFTECFLGFPGCGDSLPCSMHEVWKGARERILEKLRSTSVVDLSRDMEGKLNLASRPNSTTHSSPLPELQ